MPNHVTNILTIAGEQKEVNELIQFLKEGERAIDFNKILPMPIELQIDSVSTIENAVKVALKMPLHENKLIAMLEAQNMDSFKSPLDFDEKTWDMYIQSLNNVRKHGYICWYTWAVEKWGTKWNAYDTKQVSNVIQFDTAWSSPTDLIQLLSQQNPNLEFSLKYADEDTGSNVGHLIFSNGNVTFENIPENLSNEAYEMAFEVKPSSKEYYILNEGKYEYKDKE